MRPQVTMQDLLPTAADLREAARQSTAGDPASRSMGRHQGRNPDRKDTDGLSKRVVHDAALSHSSSLFDELATKMDSDPWTFPCSLRTFVPKSPGHPEKGTRPIDDPAEHKRLVVLHVRQILEQRLEAALTTGQYGGRPSWAVDVACPRPGATHQDHVATAIWKGLWTGYRHFLLLDLKNAFGLVPRRAVLSTLQKLGLDHEAARWVWRLVRIDAAVAGSRKLMPSDRTLGIEQGNPLSASLMNLVLAPIFRTLEAGMSVKVISYLDDVYVLAHTEEETRQAFYRFRQSARARGFTNVRRIWKPGDPENSKLSRIIDAFNTSVPVLKTYMVSSCGIGLAPEKVEELRSEGILTVKTGISYLRRLTSCQALTKKAVRNQNPSILRRPPRTTKDDVDTRGSLSSTVEGERDQVITPGNGGSSQYGRNPREGLHTLNRREPQREEMISGALIGDNRNPLHDMLGSGSLPSVYKEGRVCPLVVAFPPVPSKGRESSKAHGISHRGESPGTEGGDTRDRRWSGATDSSTCLSVFEPEILKTIQAGRRFRLGTTYKGALLDLRGIEDLVDDHHRLRLVVNGLLRVVRVRRRAVVKLDVLSPLLGAPDLLGGTTDLAYLRTGSRVLPDGSMEMTLSMRVHRHRQRGSAETPDVEMFIHAVGCHDRARGQLCIEYRAGDTWRHEAVPVQGPSPLATALSAVAAVLSHRQPSSVAIRLVGPLKAAFGLLAGSAPRHVVYHDALTVLRSGWAWEYRGGLLVGCSIVCLRRPGEDVCEAIAPSD